MVSLGLSSNLLATISQFNLIVFKNPDAIKTQIFSFCILFLKLLEPPCLKQHFCKGRRHFYHKVLVKIDFIKLTRSLAVAWFTDWEVETEPSCERAEAGLAAADVAVLLFVLVQSLLSVFWLANQ